MNNALAATEGQGVERQDRLRVISIGMGTPF